VVAARVARLPRASRRDASPQARSRATRRGVAGRRSRDLEAEEAERRRRQLGNNNRASAARILPVPLERREAPLVDLAITPDSRAWRGASLGSQSESRGRGKRKRKRFFPATDRTCDFRFRRPFFFFFSTSSTSSFFPHPKPTQQPNQLDRHRLPGQENVRPLR